MPGSGCARDLEEKKEESWFQNGGSIGFNPGIYPEKMGGPGPKGEQAFWRRRNAPCRTRNPGFAKKTGTLKEGVKTDACLAQKKKESDK